jgi:hypothetical protein
MSEDFFILTFLKSEIDSSRFGGEISQSLEKFGSTKDLILNADLSDENQNELRKKVFNNYREYSTRQGLFEGFPANVNWQFENWEIEKLLESLYIDYDYWNELSNYTRRPLFAAQNILAGKEVFGVSNQPFLNSSNHSQEVNFEHIILVKENQNSAKTVILEGHSRVTIYALSPKIRPKQIWVLVGYSENMSQWSCF